MLVQTGDQIVDLLRNGQGVLNIVSLGPVVSDLATELHDVAARRARDRSPTRARRDVVGEVGERTIDVAVLPHESVRFAHNSERQFAKLLDFYNIAWEYEPRTFTLEWDRDGRPAQAFTPDFYLPGVRPLHRDHDAQPEAGHQEEPQGAPAARAVPRRPDPGALPA